jgi:hypothetical protein
MAEKSIICPTGLAGKVRGLKGREMTLLGDRKAAKAGELFDNLLNACWLETIDAGPYAIDDNGKPNWAQVLVADRFYTLIQIRQATYPFEDYSFKATCPNGMCGETFGWEVNLDDLPVKKLPETSLEKFKNGEPLEAVVGGKRIKYRLTTGQDEKKATKFLRGQQQRILDLLNLRIVEIEGVERKRAWLDDLELCEYRNMINIFDEQDGGVETQIDIECPECGHQFPIDLPFGAEFFLPTKRQ